MFISSFNILIDVCSKMDTKDNDICRLCLKVGEYEFEEIDNNTMELFECLGLKLKLDLSKDPVMCQDCAKTVYKAYLFKSAYTPVQSKLPPFDVKEENVKFEARGVHEDVDPNNVVNCRICQFCRNPLEASNFTSMESLMNEEIIYTATIHIFMPETEIDEGVQICTTCRDTLDCCSKFICTCWGVEEKINAYCQEKEINNQEQVMLSDVLQHFLLMESVQCTEKYAVRKFEVPDDVDSKIYERPVKTEEIVVKDEEIDIIQKSNNNQQYILRTHKENVGKGPLTHKDTSEVGIFKCDMCTYKTNNNAILRRHLIKHKDKSEVGLYECTVCIYKTKYKSHLNDHILCHKDASEIEMFKCPECTYVAKRKYSLNSHLLTHKNNSEVEMFKCTECTYASKRKANLNIHLKRHKNISELKTYKCAQCTYETKFYYLLQKHVVTHKDASEMYKCEMCPYETRYRQHFKSHLLRHKSKGEVELHKCTLCTYNTKYKNNLKTHILTHKDDLEIKMFRCTECTYAVEDKQNLKHHLLSHENASAVETYKCAECTYEAKCKYLLRRHMISHKDTPGMKMYKCETCTYTTKYKHCLKQHLITHKEASEIEMYKCVKCTFETKYKHRLRSHVLTH